MILLCGKKRSGRTTLAGYLVQKYNVKEFRISDPVLEHVCYFYNLSYSQVHIDKDVYDKRWNATPRQLMQRTVKLFHKNYFINLLKQKIKHEKGIILISDLSYQHEIDAFPNSLVVKLERERDYVFDPEDNQELKADFVLQNNEDLELLQEKFDNIIAVLSCKTP